MCTQEVFNDYLEKKKTLSPIELAKYVCINQHKNQKRKYSGEPYHIHPFEVYGTLCTIGSTESVKIAGLLHDVVEDTDMTLEEVEILFGQEVRIHVSEVTNVSTLADGNRAARKAIDRKHTAAASAGSKTIKLADFLSNAKTIKEFDIPFWRVYSREKKMLLPFLKEGNKTLYKMAQVLLH